MLCIFRWLVILGVIYNGRIDTKEMTRNIGPRWTQASTVTWMTPMVIQELTSIGALLQGVTVTHWNKCLDIEYCFDYYVWFKSNYNIEHCIMINCPS